MFQNRHYARRAVARPAGRVLQREPDDDRARAGPVDVSAACPALAAWDLQVNLDSTGALLFARFMDRFGTGPRASRTRSTSPTRSTRRSASTPPTAAVGDGARRRGHRPAGARTSRSTRPTATSTTSRAARSGSRSTAARAARASSTRSPTGSTRRPGYDDITARLELRDGHRVRRDDECPNDRSILTYSLSDEPELQALRRPDADVLAEEVGRPAVLPEARSSGRRAARR